ncbi:MAG TPA: hypothetical protein VGG28_09610 [Kofleriaceae bacterium]
MQFLARAVSRWWSAIACVAIVGGAVLLGGLGSFGLWEPQERQLADKLNAPVTPAPKPVAAAAVDACPKSAPKDADARSLQSRAIAFGKDNLADSDAGERLPFAILGLLALLATAGIAIRTIGARAGVITALVLLSMPLLVLQSRQLNSEIGTATGGALSIYGLLALGSFGDVVRALPLGLAPPRRRPLIAVVDAIVGALALALGIALGYCAGGGLLGVVAPIGAFAVVGALGIPTLADGVRLVRNSVLSLVARISPRRAIGRSLWPYRRDRNATALLATAIAAVVLAALIYQMFSLRDPQPGLTPPEREVLGHAIVAPACWSHALGGVWRAEDDIRIIYDGTFEQIAYGTFPWGVLAPIAFASLLAMTGKRRMLGALALAWAGATWIASEIFLRKVGFMLYAGFPAFALAIGAWLDALLERSDDDGESRWPAAGVLVGAFAVLAIVDLGKDLQSFTEKLTSLLVGGDSIPYPPQSEWLFVPTRLWLLVLGGVFALAFAFALSFRGRRAGRIGAIVTGALTIGFAAFWAFGWQPALAQNLSSKTMFDAITDLAKPGDQLVIMGDLGGAPKDYAPALKPEPAAGRPAIIAALNRANRVFAIAPETERCAIHREMGAKPYYLIDDRNAHSLLLSNKLDGTTDKNPLSKMIVHAEPANIRFKPKGRVVWENKIQLLGWDIPPTVSRSSRFQVITYYKILGSVGQSYTALYHFDSNQFGRAFNGDHAPIDGKCATSTWQAGDYIIDTNTIWAGNATTPKGTYEVWTGFFTGSSGNYKNMTLSEAPGDMRDPTDRVKITTIVLD